MNSKIVFIVEPAPEGGYTARAPGESIFTEADAVEYLHKQVHGAARNYFEDKARSKAIRKHFANDEVIAACGCRAIFPAKPSPERPITNQATA